MGDEAEPPPTPPALRLSRSNARRKSAKSVKSLKRSVSGGTVGSKTGSSRRDLFEEGGLIEDEFGEQSFRFRRQSIYEPPPPHTTQAISRASLVVSRTYGSGFAGPLIIREFLGEEDEDEEHFSLTPDGEKKKKKGRKKIKLLGCIGVIIGCVLGSGIFAAPQEIQSYTENAGMTLIVWFTYGIIALVGALCYVELGCTIPVSGGDYAYLNESFGPLPAFLFQWASNIIIIPTVIAILSNVVAKNIIHPYVSDTTCAEVRYGTITLAVAIIFLVVFINWKSGDLAAKIQGWLMIINVSTIILIIVCGMISVGMNGVKNKGNFVVNVPDTANKTQDRERFVVLNLVLALYQSSFSYLGYSYVTYIMEDVENPMRNLPIAICISIPLVICVNVFVNFCYLATIKLEDMKKSEIIASEMMKAVVSEKAFGYVKWVAPSLVAIAVMGGLMSNVLTCSRVAYIGARNGHFPSIFATTHLDSLTPVVSLAFLGLLGSAFAFVDLKILIGMLTYIVSASGCAVIYGLIYMRITRPLIPRPFKLPLFIPIAYAFTATSLFCIPIFLLDKETYKSTLQNLGIATAFVLAGIPIYFLFVVNGSKWSCCVRTHGHLLVFLQKTWLILPEEMEEEELRGMGSEDTIELASRSGSTTSEEQ